MWYLCLCTSCLINLQAWVLPTLHRDKTQNTGILISFVPQQQQQTTTTAINLYLSKKKVRALCTMRRIHNFEELRVVWNFGCYRCSMPEIACTNFTYEYFYESINAFSGLLKFSITYMRIKATFWYICTSFVMIRMHIDIFTAEAQVNRKRPAQIINSTLNGGWRLLYKQYTHKPTAIVIYYC